MAPRSVSAPISSNTRFSSFLCLRLRQRRKPATAPNGASNRIVRASGDCGSCDDRWPVCQRAQRILRVLHRVPGGIHNVFKHSRCWAWLSKLTTGSPCGTLVFRSGSAARPPAQAVVRVPVAWAARAGLEVRARLRCCPNLALGQRESNRSRDANDAVCASEAVTSKTLRNSSNFDA